LDGVKPLNSWVKVRVRPAGFYDGVTATD